MSVLTLISICAVALIVERVHSAFYLDLHDSDDTAEETAGGFALPDSDLLEVLFALQQRNIETLEEKALEAADPDGSLYGKFLSPEDIAELIAPAEKDRQSLSDFVSHHFPESDLQFVRTQDFALLNATVAQVNAAFNTTVVTRRARSQPGRRLGRVDLRKSNSIVTFDHPPVLPPDVEKVVESISLFFADLSESAEERQATPLNLEGARPPDTAAVARSWTADNETDTTAVSDDPSKAETETSPESAAETDSEMHTDTGEESETQAGPETTNEAQVETETKPETETVSPPEVSQNETETVPPAETAQSDATTPSPTDTPANQTKTEAPSPSPSPSPSVAASPVSLSIFPSFKSSALASPQIDSESLVSANGRLSFSLMVYCPASGAGETSRSVAASDSLETGLCSSSPVDRLELLMQGEDIVEPLLNTTSSLSSSASSGGETGPSSPSPSAENGDAQESEGQKKPGHRHSKVVFLPALGGASFFKERRRMCGGTECVELQVLVEDRDFLLYKRVRLRIRAVFAGEGGAGGFRASEWSSYDDAPSVTCLPIASPGLLSTLYGLPLGTELKGPHRSVGIAEFLEQYFLRGDLEGFRESAGIMSSSLVDEGDGLLSVKGPNDEQIGAVTGEEAALDVEWVNGIAPNVKTVVLSFGGRDASSGEEPFLRWSALLSDSPLEWEPEEMKEEVHTDRRKRKRSLRNQETTETEEADRAKKKSTRPPLPLVHSISYGDDEKEFTPETVRRLHIETLKLAARGATVLAASGDDGVAAYKARTDSSVCSEGRAELPGSLPFVTSVGGTMLSRDWLPLCRRVGGCDPPGEVLSQHDLGGKITGGGGFSSHFDAPEYQKKAVATYLKQSEMRGELPGNTTGHTFSFNRKGRGHPDLSAVAVNFPIRMGSRWTLVSGTSASTPLVALMATLWNDLRLSRGLPPLGFLNPLIYTLGETGGFFNDVVVGNNRCAIGNCCPVGFYASPGWDVTTGWGSPRWQRIADEILRRAGKETAALNGKGAGGVAVPATAAAVPVDATETGDGSPPAKETEEAQGPTDAPPSPAPSEEPSTPSGGGGEGEGGTSEEGEGELEETISIPAGEEQPDGEVIEIPEENEGDKDKPSESSDSGLSPSEAAEVPEGPPKPRRQMFDNVMYAILGLSSAVVLSTLLWCLCKRFVQRAGDDGDSPLGMSLSRQPLRIPEQRNILPPDFDDADDEEAAGGTASESHRLAGNGTQHGSSRGGGRKGNSGGQSSGRQTRQGRLTVSQRNMDRPGAGGDTASDSSESD
uniref:subtilisin n=1 Tax=Chromera velia CCMP2878 TaxID=1169474 RepID=A0A0G4I472_9ALVE|eukprot:Cvel_10854.t1-p1 / transcript=Cvel_10854.t1 / gene=Cvel_10854 / organism=Chromera_velia_CCMP2878 / gene_product=Tripeptidyl-peptidase 1, putative / transcript_product=Tripeptidyl-peptidase 1, putative / location=Cvel_scaffold664:52867-59076(-) / protein_length=1274 / sequence_SO=supercontig / SO=protein_coding / is_pseudo=false